MHSELTCSPFDQGVTINPEDYTTLWGWITFNWVEPMISRVRHPAPPHVSHSLTHSPGHIHHPERTRRLVPLPAPLLPPPLPQMVPPDLPTLNPPPQTLGSKRPRPGRRLHFDLHQRRVQLPRSLLPEEDLGLAGSEGEGQGREGLRDCVCVRGVGVCQSVVQGACRLFLPCTGRLIGTCVGPSRPPTPLVRQTSRNTYSV